MKEIKLYINGDFKNSSDGKTIDSINPATGEIYAKCAIPSGSDVELAVDSAYHAFYSPEWRSFDQNKRADLLLAISEKLKERKKDFIEAEIADSGAVAKKAIADLHNSASFFKVMSKVAKTFNFEEKDENASREGFSFNYRSYQPIGVCAQIIPWNFPLVMAAWKIGPILATGCTTVLKTAKETPASAMLLAEVLNEVGLPKGVVNIITGGREVVKNLITNPKVSKVAFTGSTEVGKEILRLCSPGIKNCTLELGGKSPNIILDDADLDIAVDGALYAFLYHQGQACTSGTRLLVQDGIYDEFIKRFQNRIAQVKIGKTDDMTVGYGPMINENQFKSVMNYIDLTKKEGAKLLFGGNRITGGEFDKGYYISPTAFEITQDNTIFQEEIFGPVVGVTRFKNIEEAIDLANNSIYGLAGAVWSKDVEKAKDVARKIETGTVWINEYHLLNPGMPFGGYKQSGLGREMGKEGILAYLEVKHLWISDCSLREKKPWFDHLF